MWGQPSYYVTQMIARHYLPLCVRADAKSPGAALDVTAKRDEAGKVLQLQVVNLDRQAVTTAITLEGFTPAGPTARVLELAGKLEDDNTPGQPEHVAPKAREWRHQAREGRLEYTFPPYSFTILRFE